MQKKHRHLSLLLKGALFSAIFFASFFAFASTAHAAAPPKWADPKNPTCGWKDTAHLECNASDQGTSDAGGVSADYYLDPESTLAAGHPVFRAARGSLNLSEAVAQFGYVHILNNDYKVAYISDSRTDGLSGYKQDPIANDSIPLDQTNTPPKLDGTTQCGLTYLKAGCALGFTKDGDVQKTSLTQSDLDKVNQIISLSLNKYANNKLSEENCAQDSGGLGFVLCPLLKAIQSSIEKLIGTEDANGKGFLVELLTIRPLSTTNTPELYNGWQVIRNVTLAGYVLIFALIVFGNGVGYDPYTIKKALPKLAIGVLLTFASFWIVQIVIDLSNLLGNVVPFFIQQISGQSGITDFKFDFNFGFQGIAIILLLIFAIVALGALLVGLAGLITRIIIIYALVLLAPVAFLAWVLPNTESLFKKWWKNLVKVAMMFPIVTGMLALSLFFSKVMSNAASTAAQQAGGAASTGTSISNGVLGIAGALAPLIAIILIPKTFKWGGEAFAAAAGYAAGKASGLRDRGTNAAKGFAGNTAERTRNRVAAGMLERSKSNADKAGSLNGGAKVRASMAGRAQRMLGTTAAGKLPSKRGLVAAGVRANKAVGEQTELEETAAQYYSSGELKSQMERSASKLASNPNNAMELARFRGLQKMAVKSNNLDALNASKDMFKTNQDAYTKASMPNLGDIGDKFASAGAYDTKGGADFDVKGLSAEKIAGQHVKMLTQWGQDGTFTKMSSDQIKSLKEDPRLRQKMSANQQEQIDKGISQWEAAHPVYGPPMPSRVSSPGSGGNMNPTPSGPSAPIGGGLPPRPTGSAPWSVPTAAQQAAAAGRPLPPAPASGAPSPTPPAVTPAAQPAPSAPGSNYNPGYTAGSANPAGTSTNVNVPSTTTIINNTSFNQVMQQSGSLRAQMAGGGMDAYGDLMRKMDSIDARLASGRVDTFALKKDLKRLRFARDAAPESMRGQIDDYMRGAESAAGIPQNAGDHDDVDISGE